MKLILQLIFIVSPSSPSPPGKLFLSPGKSQARTTSKTPSSSRHISSNLSVYLFLNSEPQLGKKLLEAILFCHQKSNGKTDRLCMRFHQSPNTTVQKCLNHSFQYPFFFFFFFFLRMSPGFQDQQNDKIVLITTLAPQDQAQGYIFSQVHHTCIFYHGLEKVSNQ